MKLLPRGHRVRPGKLATWRRRAKAYTAYRVALNDCSLSRADLGRILAGWLGLGRIA